MEKIDYLETKINEILYELNYIKEDVNKTKKTLSGVQTHNFIFNSNFLINQQGSESYSNTTGVESKETADKWILTGKGTYENNGRTFLYPSAYLSQTLELDDGIRTLLGNSATLTLFVRDMYGQKATMGVRIWTDADNYTEETRIVSGVADNSLSFNVPNETIKMEVFVENRNIVDTESFVNIAWVKLELGSSYTNYIYPSYEEDYLKCNTKQVEYCQTIYDMKSTDSAINLGYTSGIKGGTSIKTLDISKFKRLKIYSVINWDYSVLDVDLTLLVGSYDYYSNAKANPRVSSNTMYTYGSYVSIDSAKKSIYITFFRNNTYYNNNANYYCYKIEGIY